MGVRAHLSMPAGMVSDDIMIYGATGLTGRKMVRRAVERGLRPILAGRNHERVQPLASAFGLMCKIFDLQTPQVVEENIRGIGILVNCAGPFSATALPLATACLNGGAHYLDVSGELDTFETLFELDRQARMRGILIMPGVGFAVVPTDCMVARLHRMVPDGEALRIGLSRPDLVSRGTANSIVKLIDAHVCVRRGGVVRRVAPGSLKREFDFGNGPVACMAVSWADVFTAYLTSGVPDIEVYTEASWLEQVYSNCASTFAPVLGLAPFQVAMKSAIARLPEQPETAGPDSKRIIVGEIVAADGRRGELKLQTPNGYDFTVDAMVSALEFLSTANIKPGFQTPASVLGEDFVFGLEGVSCLESEYV